MNGPERMSAAAYRKLLGLSASEAKLKPKPRQYHEADLQAAMVELAGLILQPEVILFSVPNERTDPAERARLRRTGVLAGVADLVLVGGFGQAYFVEVKTSTGRQSAAQSKFEQCCRDIGAPYAVVRSLDEFRDELEQWELTKEG